MRYVRYVGAAHRRVITEADWKSVRQTGPQVVWEAQNGHAVPIDMFNEEQIKRVIDPDPDLVITDEDYEPKFASYDMTPREAALAHENPVDVVDVLNGTAGPVPTISTASPVRSTPTGDSGTVQRGDMDQTDEDDEDLDLDTRTNQDRLA